MKNFLYIFFGSLVVLFFLHPFIIHAGSLQNNADSTAVPEFSSTTKPLSVTIVYPPQGENLPYLKNSFVYGYVSHSSATLRINNISVPIYHTGSFIEYIPFSPGHFKIEAEVNDNVETAKTVRTVIVASLAEPLPIKPLKIDKNSVYPSTHMVLMEGDLLTPHFQGSPSCKAEYRVKDLKSARYKSDWKKMAEKNSPVPGIYEAKELLLSDSKTDIAIIEYRLTNSKGQSVKASSVGRIKIVDKDFFTVMEVSTDAATLRTGPSIGHEQMGYDLFLPKGTKLKAVGKIGNEVRLKLSDSVVGWAYEKYLKALPNDLLFSKKIMGDMRTQNKEKSTVISMDIAEKVPYRVTVSNDLKLLTLTFYYAISNTDRIHYDTQNENGFLKQIRWFQTSKDTLDVRFQLEKEIWGYDVSFEDDKLVCEIIFPPQLKNDKKFPLQGITVAIDPGHSSETGDGTISPQGITEGKVNFEMAEVFKEVLEKLGAKVFLTREREEKVDLFERGKRAWRAGADLFVSLHCNALADGQKPFERHGYSVFYFQPYSLDLGRSVHSEFKKSIPLKDDGFYYGNLAVCRATQMPAILVESAYLIHPEEEELLLDEDFQRLVSQTISNGIIQFLRGIK